MQIAPVRYHFPQTFKRAVQPNALKFSEAMLSKFVVAHLALFCSALKHVLNSRLPEVCLRVPVVESIVRGKHARQAGIFPHTVQNKIPPATTVSLSTGWWLLSIYAGNHQQVQWLIIRKSYKIKATVFLAPKLTLFRF